REGLNKWTRRHDFDLTAVWTRERLSRGQAEAIHCHLLFHLALEYQSGVARETNYSHLRPVEHGHRQDRRPAVRRSCLKALIRPSLSWGLFWAFPVTFLTPACVDSHRVKVAAR